MKTLKINSIKKILIVALLSIVTSQTFAQSSNGIFFQAVARDNFSNPAKDRNIYVQSTIIQNTTTGTKVLIEVHKSSTDAMGVFNITIGNGQRTGGAATSIAAIDWSKGPFYLNLKIAITPLSASDSWDYAKELVDMGTTSFGAVPFAFYSASSAKVDDKLNATDTTKMLAVYAKAMSVKTLETSLATKLTAADTLTMLAPYAKVAYTIDSNFFRTQLATKLNLTDTIKYSKQKYTDSLLLKKLNLADSTLYVTPTQLAAKTFDQTAINTTIASKLNIGDSTKSYVTPSQLASYNFSSGGGGTAIDTSSLSSRINLKANANDLTSLNINVSSNTISIVAQTTAISTKLNITDTSYLLKKTDTASLSNRINLKASISYVDTQIANVSIADADVNNKGKIQLAGDLTGSAAAPIIANNAITTAKVIDGGITNAKIATGIDATKITGDIAGKASNVTGKVAITNGGTNAVTASAARTNLGLEIGTDVQAPLSFTSPLIKNGTTISLNQATSSVDGYITASDFTSFSNKIDASQKAANNGIATLGNDGKIPSVQIPAISFQSASVVNSETAMLSLSGLVVGSIAIRTDANKNFVLSATPSSTLANWVELATPNSVTSVNSLYGPNVTLTSDDISEGATNKYFTTARARSAISTSSPLSYNASSGTISMTTASASNNGYLTAIDFTTFNNKQNTLTAGVDYITPNSSINAATKTKITYDAKGLVLAGANATTADIAASTNKNYVSDIQSAVLSNTSGINTGDQTIILTGDVTGRGTGNFTTTVNTVGGVSSSTISNFDTRINANTNSITTNTADILSKASIASPNFSGVPTAPTASSGTNTTQIATTAFVTASTLAAVPDATSLLKGKIKLVNDLGGTADAPTVNSIGGVSSSTIANFDSRITSVSNSITSNTSSITSLNTSINAATATNTASTIVKRDASGNFTAGTITAALTGNASTATKLAATKTINGVAFDGSSDIVISASAGTLSGTVAVANGGTGAATATQNYIFAGPATGSTAAAPGFRALAAADIPASAISFDKIQNISTGKLLGSISASAAAPSEVTVGTGLSLLNGSLTATNGGTVTSLSGITIGTSGNDITASIANASTTPSITLNIPDASATARGVVTTGVQTIAGAKTFSGNTAIAGTLNVTGVTTLTAAPVLSSTTASQALFTDASKNVVSKAVTGTGDVVLKDSPSFSGTVTIPTATVSGAITAKNYVTTVPAATTAAATTSIDFSTGNIFKLSLGTNITTLSISNAVAGTYLLEIIQGGTFTVAFPAAWKWSGGSAPTITATSGKTDIITIVYDGTTYFASAVQNF